MSGKNPESQVVRNVSVFFSQEIKATSYVPFPKLMAIRRESNSSILHSAFVQGFTILQNSIFTAFAPTCQIILRAEGRGLPNPGCGLRSFFRLFFHCPFMLHAPCMSHRQIKNAYLAHTSCVNPLTSF